MSVLGGDGTGPAWLGVVNVTPDSFSDGGAFVDPARAVEHGRRLLDEGAHSVDVGGESTRPGAQPVPPSEQIRRVIPVIAALARDGAFVSVDTTSPEVAAAALDSGARAVNDVSGSSDPELAAVVARARAELVIMHARGAPAEMQRDTAYADLVGEVEAFLRERAARAVAAGVDPAKIALDPGLGFGKAWDDNPRLVAAVPRLKALGFAVVIGGSRKAFVGYLSGVREPADRVHGSIGVALAAGLLGADAVRVHDVAATRRAWATFAACLPAAEGRGTE